MDITLIKKQIKAVAKTYTEQDICLPLNVKEEEELTQKILKKLEERNSTDLRDIVHDVVYSFLTGQEDE